MGSDQLIRDDERLLEEWLAQGAAHAAEFNAHAAIFNGIASLANNDEARAILMGSRLRPAPSRRLSRRQMLGGGLTLAAAVVTAVVVGTQIFSGSKTFTTRPGEQRRYPLADGSTVMLNTDSLLRVQFDKAERRLFLERGQVWFEVARARDRPFRVFVGENEIRALGTAFDVRRDGETVKVTLEQGKVAIFVEGAHAAARSENLAANIAPALILQPGQEVKLTPTKLPQVVGVNLARAQAWRSGRLVLDSTPLGEAMEDFNRYGGAQLVLTDPSLARLPISGVFDSRRPEAFAESVAAAFSIRATIENNGTIVLSPAKDCTAARKC
jgi:transmembrane sensor